MQAQMATPVDPAFSRIESPELQLEQRLVDQCLRKRGVTVEQLKKMPPEVRSRLWAAVNSEVAVLLTQHEMTSHATMGSAWR
jgi:hypothetical protein